MAVPGMNLTVLPYYRKEARVRWRLPQGLALDRDGLIAMAEFSNDRVVVMDRHGRQVPDFPLPMLASGQGTLMPLFCRRICTPVALESSSLPS